MREALAKSASGLSRVGEYHCEYLLFIRNTDNSQLLGAFIRENAGCRSSLGACCRRLVHDRSIA